jgi:hypothetical protein
VKVFATLVLVLAGLVPCYADSTTQTWDVTTSCEDEMSIQYACRIPAVMSAVFTVEGDTVLSIMGTFDGLPITDGSGSWIAPFPDNVCFEAGTATMCLEQYVDDTFLSGPLSNENEFLNWYAQLAAVPEPSTMLLLTVPLLLGLMKWAQMNLRSMARCYLRSKIQP